MATKLPIDLARRSLRYALLAALGGDRTRAPPWNLRGGLKNFNDRHQTILSVLRGWAKIDPQSAATWIEQLPPGRLRNEAPGAIARALAESDPEAAFAMLKNAKADRNYGYGAYYELFDALGREGPGNRRHARRRRFAKLRSNGSRRIATSPAAGRKQDVPAALAWAQEPARWPPDVRAR